jgi:hypothetical protein
MYCERSQEIRITVDSREPSPHPWGSVPASEPERGTLETGDLALSMLPAGAIVERKTATEPGLARPLKARSGHRGAKAGLPR